MTATMPPYVGTPVLYLDIDGTVREGKDDPLGKFVNSWEDVRVFPAAVERMREWREFGGRIVGVSNQGGIALGHVTEEDVTLAMVETHRQADELFDKIVWCQHFPGAKTPDMGRCWCRKPRAGLVWEAANALAEKYPGEFYPPLIGLFVGDRNEDRECARAANLDFMWAVDWREERVARTFHPDQDAS